MQKTNFLHEGEQHITQVVKKYFFKWCIHNFSCTDSQNLVLPSTSFKIQCGSLFPVTGTLNISGPCSNRNCNLRLIGVGYGTNKAIVKLYVEGKEGKQRSSAILAQDTRLDCALTNPSFANACLLCKGDCTIICEINTMEYFTYELPEIDLNERSFLRYDEELFSNKKHCDVVFFVSGEEIRAHKCILASRNKVFAAMFEHEMKENKLNTVAIEDTHPEVFEDMLRYIYTGEVMRLKKYSYELLAISEKYDIQNLKLLCVHEILRNITVENAAKTLYLADLYRADRLKTAVITFITTRREEVCNSEGWTTYLTKNEQLLAELFFKTT